MMKRRSFIKTDVMSIGALAMAKKGFSLEYYPNKSDKMLHNFGDYDLMHRSDFLEFGKTILASVK